MYILNSEWSEIMYHHLPCLKYGPTTYNVAPQSYRLASKPHEYYSL